MGNFGARKVLRYLAPAVTALSFVLLRLIGGRGTNEFRCDCCWVDVEEMLLTRRLDQPLATRAEPEAFHCLVLLLEAVVGALDFAIGRARFVKLALQVTELSFHFVEPLEKAAQQVLTGGQIIRDLARSLHHDHIYVSDGAMGRHFLSFFRNFPQDDQLARA